MSRGDEPGQPRRDGCRKTTSTSARASGGVAEAGALPDALGQRVRRGRPQRLRAYVVETIGACASASSGSSGARPTLAPSRCPPGPPVHRSRRRRADSVRVLRDDEKWTSSSSSRTSASRRTRLGERCSPEGGATAPTRSQRRSPASTSSLPATLTSSSRRGDGDVWVSEPGRWARSRPIRPHAREDGLRRVADPAVKGRNLPMKKVRRTQRSSRPRRTATAGR